MRRSVYINGSVLFLCVLMLHAAGMACTNFLITKSASVDGSTMITYAADAHDFYGELYHTPGGRFAEGTMLNVYEWDSGKLLGQIRQVPLTYTTVGNMNEFQVSIGETTFGGRKELAESKGILDYGSLIYITLQRAKTAREAIEIMAALTEEYGYASSGESLSIADPNEVWIMEIIGKGPENKGAVWVARKVPEGYISAHANQARIREFPLNDKLNCLYARDVITFAREKGFFKGEDKDFSFADVYAPIAFGGLRFCEARVWCMFNRVASSLKLSSDYIKGDPTAERLPLWVKPDKKLSVHDVMTLMRDHYENTDLDMTKDVGAGPFKLPYRWRPMTWEVDGQQYLHERAVSTQQTAFSFVAQMRASLPNPIGGVLWFGVDDTYSTVYVPMYCGIHSAPEPFAVGNGSFEEFSWDAAFWAFNFVSNYTYSRYCDMIQDVQIIQRELEGKFLANQAVVEQAALKLHQQAPRLAADYLTDYSAKMSEETLRRWKKLGEFLIWKYLDGNVKNDQGKPTHPKYPEAWYRTIVNEAGDKLKVREIKKQE